MPSACMLFLTDVRLLLINVAGRQLFLTDIAGAGCYSWTSPDVRLLLIDALDVGFPSGCYSRTSPHVGCSTRTSLNAGCSTRTSPDAASCSTWTLPRRMSSASR